MTNLNMILVAARRVVARVVPDAAPQPRLVRTTRRGDCRACVPRGGRACSAPVLSGCAAAQGERTRSGSAPSTFAGATVECPTRRLCGGTARCAPFGRSPGAISRSPRSISGSGSSTRRRRASTGALTLAPRLGRGPRDDGAHLARLWPAGDGAWCMPIAPSISRPVRPAPTTRWGRSSTRSARPDEARRAYLEGFRARSARRRGR